MSESENLEDILSSMKEDRLFTLPTFPFPPPPYLSIYMFASAGHPQYSSKGSFKLFSAFTLGSLISGQEGGGAEAVRPPFVGRT